MHVELVVPALFPAQGRAAALELLLGRARRSEGGAGTLEAWMARAFDLPPGGLPAGALTALAAGFEPAQDWWLRGDPVHLRAGREGVRLMPGAGFSIAAENAAALAVTLNGHFAADFSVHVVRPDLWCLRATRDLPVQSRPPLEIAGRSIDKELPDKRFHALLNEIQMALHGHPVNEAREARGEPPVNGIWLWGAGRLPGAARGPWQSVSADDPCVLGLARLAGVRHGAPGAGAAEWLGRAPGEGRHLVVLDALRAPQALGDTEAWTRGLAELEAHWFAPLLAALRAGRLGMVTVHLPEPGASFETARADLRRFWRRAPPLPDYPAPGA